MKKYIFLSFIFLSFHLWAQTSQDKEQTGLVKGHWLVGLSSTNFNFKYVIKDDFSSSHQTSYAGDLNAIYMVSKGVGLGLFTSYHYNELMESLVSRRYYIALGPQMRFYFKSKGHFLPFAEFGAGYINFLKWDGDGMLANVALGGSYFIHKNIALDAGIHYGYADMSMKNILGQHYSTSSNTLGLQLGFSIFL